MNYKFSSYIDDDYPSITLTTFSQCQTDKQNKLYILTLQTEVKTPEF